MRAHAKETASRKLFDEWSGRYEQMRLSGWFQYTQELALAHLDVQADSRVLDVGCGTGYAVRQLATMVPKGRAAGVDISPGMIEQAKRLASEELVERVEFRVGPASDLPFSDGTFTHVLCTNSFHHYPDPLRALAEVRRVLAPDGRFLVLENAPDLSVYAWLWDRVLRLIETGHVRYYSSDELRSLLVDAGFSQVELLAVEKAAFKRGKLFACIQLWQAEQPGVPRA